MIELIKNLSGSFFITAVVIYIVSYLIDEKVKFQFEKIIYFCLTVFTLVVNSIYCPPLLRIFTSTIILIAFCKLFFKSNLFKVICGVVIEQILFLCAEIIYMIGVSILLRNHPNIDITSTFGTLLTNLMISIIALLFIKIPLVKNIYEKLNNLFENISNKKLMIFLGSATLIINLLLGISYFKSSIVTLLIVNGSFIAFILYTLYSILQEKNLNLKYKDENNALQDSLHTYENLVDHHRVISHENKNQLGVIKQMVESGDKTVVQYIEKLVKQTYKKDESLLEKTKRIPSGGLQGIIYQKLLLMKEKDIPYALNISRDIKISDFKKLDMDTNIDLCKIIGVFLDNAIEEVERLENKKIIVDVYMEDGNFCVKVTNDYGPGIDFSKIDDKGYTTKEDGHGYGLSLVKEIMERNHRFTNLRTITGKTFGQIIMVNNMSIDE